MDLGLGLSIGRCGAGRKRATGGENSGRSGRRPAVEEKHDDPSPSLQLELQLSWPNNIHPAGSPHGRGGFTSTPSWRRTKTTAAAPPRAPAGPTAPSGSGVLAPFAGEPPKATCREMNCGVDGGRPSSWTLAGRRCIDEEGGGGVTAPRKKLRLTKEQSFYLEESFKEHATLTPEQKLAIAERLTLRPRQVEVWFQNRRARTKLKQTEVEYDYLRRCCQSLAEENGRLRREIQELRAPRSTTPACSPRPPLPAATSPIVCPFCEGVAADRDGRKLVTRSSSGFFFPSKLRRGYPKMAPPVS